MHLDLLRLGFFCGREVQESSSFTCVASHKPLPFAEVVKCQAQQGNGHFFKQQKVVVGRSQHDIHRATHGLMLGAWRGRVRGSL